MADFAANRILSFNASEGGSGLVASSNFSNSGQTTTVTDTNMDGNIDSVDTWGNSSFSLPYSGYTIRLNGDDYAEFTNGGAGYYVPYNNAETDLSGFHGVNPNTIGFTSTPENAEVVNCFLTGTLIDTPDGPRAIETLSTGDVVTTLNGPAPIRWVARQTMRADAVNLTMPATRLPVKIEAGALGGGLPHTDLTLTADHALALEGYLVNASALVNGTSIRFLTASEMPREFTYWHLELDTHAVILANGVPSESFVDYTGRAAYDNHDAYLAIYGAERIIPEMTLPRISSRRHLPASLLAQLGATDASFELSA